MFMAADESPWSKPEVVQFPKTDPQTVGGGGRIQQHLNVANLYLCAREKTSLLSSNPDPQELPGN